MEGPKKPKMKESKENPPYWHEELIARDSVKYPTAAVFLVGLKEKDAIKKLKEKFGYTDNEIELLKFS